jgi:hypothetical protein
MKKKEYMKPDMQVIEMQQKNFLLAGSSGDEVIRTITGEWTTDGGTFGTIDDIEPDL